MSPQQETPSQIFTQAGLAGLGGLAGGALGGPIGGALGGGAGGYLGYQLAPGQRLF